MAEISSWFTYMTSLNVMLLTTEKKTNPDQKEVV